MAAAAAPPLHWITSVGDNPSPYPTRSLSITPPNTEMALVANVAGATAANDKYWADQCKSIPANASFLVLDMGAVRDFFRPANASTVYCDMLQAHDKHQWSPDGVEWFAINFDSESPDDNGGSADWWIRDMYKGQKGDARRWLSFWGKDDGQPGEDTGGCCSTSTTVAQAGWGQSFTLSYAITATTTATTTTTTFTVTSTTTSLTNSTVTTATTTTTTFTATSTTTFTATPTRTSVTGSPNSAGQESTASVPGAGSAAANETGPGTPTRMPTASANLGAILGPTFGVLALVISVAGYAVVSRRRTSSAANARAAVQQEYQNDEDRRNTLPMQVNPHSAGLRESPPSAATTATTAFTTAARNTITEGAHTEVQNANASTDDKYGNVIYTPSTNAASVAAENAEDSTVGGQGSAEYSIVSRPAAANRMGHAAGRMPSHDNYSGYDVSASQAGAVYSVPVADEDEDEDDGMYENETALDADADADASGVYDMGPPGERAPRPGAANGSGPYSGCEPPLGAANQIDNAPASIVYATPVLEEEEGAADQQIQRHVERTPNVIYKPHIPGGNRNVQRFPNPLYGGGGPGTQAGSSEQ